MFETSLGGNSISGQVTDSGSKPITGVKFTYTDGVSKFATSDYNGYYSFLVSDNWSGTVTPSKIGYTFDPASRSYTDVLVNQPGENYTATAITYTISGNAGWGCKLKPSVGTPKTATADSNGNYSLQSILQLVWYGHTIQGRLHLFTRPSHLLQRDYQLDRPELHCHSDLVPRVHADSSTLSSIEIIFRYTLAIPTRKSVSG